MQFFQKLYEHAKGLNLTMELMEKNGVITMMILPRPGNKSMNISALRLRGTPEDLDNEFFDKLSPAVEKVKGVVDNLEEFSKDLAEEERSVKEESNKNAKGAQSKKASAKKSTPPVKKSANKKVKAETPVKKSAKKKRGPQIVEQSIFGSEDIVTEETESTIEPVEEGSEEETES